MAEVTATGGDHGHAVCLGSGHDLGVALGAAGLDRCRDAGAGTDLETVGEGEEGVAGHHGTPTVSRYSRVRGRSRKALAPADTVMTG